MNDLEALKEKLGIESWNALTSEQTFELLKMAGKASIEKQQLLAVAKIAPQFVNMAVQVSKQMVETAAQHAKVQSDAIAGLREGIAALERISARTRNDAIIMSIIDKIFEITKALERISERNAALGMNVIRALLATVVVVGGIALRIARA